jgi:hypothetical protein
MQRSDGLCAHAMIRFQGSGALVIWFLNEKPMGIRDFVDWKSAVIWSDRMQVQNRSVGWRDAYLPTEMES